MEGVRLPCSKEIILSAEDQAAITIQCAWRGRVARLLVASERRHCLDYDLFQAAIFYIKEPEKKLYEQLPEVPTGNTSVYLPKDAPVVLKLSGIPANQKRSDQMRVAREFCLREGLDLLVVPKARVYNKFIIEDRLPITVDTKYQFGLYREYSDTFTPAVKQFVRFICQSTLDDIAGETRNPYGPLSKSSLGRSDNLPLFIEDGVGKIGLIDLEKYHPECNKENEKWCYYKCDSLVCLFPLHLEEILDVAREFDPKIDQHRKNLESCRKQTMLRIDIAYDKHKRFIQEKGVSYDTPTKIVEMSKSRKHTTYEKVIARFQHDHGDDWQQKYRADLQRDAIANLEASFTKVVDTILTFLTTMMERKAKGKPIESIQELLVIRTVIFGDEDLEYFQLLGMVCPLLYPGYNSDLDHEPTEEELALEKFTCEATMNIIAQLVEDGVLAYSNPKFGYRGYPKMCIFC